MRHTSFGENKNQILDRFFSYLRMKRVTPILKSFNRPITVADLGCGYEPRSLLNLMNKFPQITSASGIDLSISQAEFHPKIRIVEGNLNEPLPYPDNSFDLVFSMAVLEHLDNHELALTEAFRILKKDGTLLLTTPSPLSRPILEFLAYKLKVIDEHEIRDHKNYFSKKDLEEKFKETGFRNIKAKTFQFGFNNLAQGTK